MQTQRDVVIKVFNKRKKLTDLELQGLVPFNPNSIRPIRIGLTKDGFITKTSEKRNGYTVYEINTEYKPNKKKPKANIVKSLRQNKKLLKKAYEQVNELIKQLT